MKLIVVVITGAVLAAGCAPDDRNHGPYPKEHAANAVKPTDPKAEGQWYFFHETWGTEQTDEWPPADFMLSLMSDPRFGDQYAKFGFLHDDDDDFPIGFKRGTVDETKVHETCGLCHVAELPDGTRWLGVPNTKLDFGAFRAAVNDAWVIAGHARLGSARDMEKLRSLGPGRADTSTSDLRLAIPAAFPSYLTLSKVTALNVMGTSHNVKSEAAFSIYIAFGAGSTPGIPFPSDDKLQAFLDFFGAMAPPPAPEEAVSDPRVKRGRAVFHEARCDACHHLDHVGDDVIPTPPGDLADRMPGDDPAFPRGSIGTDRLHRVLFDGTDGTDLADPSAGGGGYVDADLLAFIASRGLSLGPSDGYRVSDLRGLAFTAPYLHNDSVPTLEDLLRPAEYRPVTFDRDGFTVSTAGLGMGNGGHEFGVDLSPTDKDALVAFLKTL